MIHKVNQCQSFIIHKIDPRHKKPGLLHMRKRRRRSALNSAFVFASRIVQSLYFQNPKFIQDTRYKKLYLTSVIVKQLTLAISYFPTNMSIKITASKAAVKERSCYHIC